MRLAAALISCVLCVTGTVGGAWLSRPASVDYGSLLSKASDIYAVTDERGDATRLYVVNNASNAAISRIPGAAAELPWKVNVTYSLDGPNVEASEISGASGLVGIYIDVKPQSSAANHTIPVVTFTVPTQVTGDISADNTVSVATQGSDIVVAAAGNVSSGLKFSCYMDAKKFSMGAVTLAALSGWILDPDHKKMSKSKGNVVVPNEPIEKFGADAVRYWAAAARLGLDATYDIGQMKIGRRLAIKLLNATKFALAIGREDENHHVGAAAETSWNPADVTEPLDRAAMAKLALVVRQATEALEAYEHSKALEVIESYFWQFCDDYIELVKNRAYGTPDEQGNVPSEKAVKSARTALGLGLDAFARLLAPYLPYASEEVWSWMHAGSGSVHRAAWPVVNPYVEAATGASPELLTWAGKAVEQLRKIKSEAKVSMKTPILSVALSAAAEGVDAIHAALGDIAQAGRVVGKFDLVAKHTAESAAEDAPETEVAVETSELGEPPVKKPKK